jgi:hypothetical protein
MTTVAVSTNQAPTKDLTVLADDNISFEYSYLPVKDLQVVTEKDKKTGKNRVKHLLVQDEEIPASNRFWNSLFSRYGFNSAFFKYFDYTEVFNRISEKSANDRMRLCIERGSKGNRLLACSNPSKPLVSYDELFELVGRYGGENVTYANGLVESTHTPRSGAGSAEIGGDAFQSRFVLSTPVDGYGLPNVYLSLLRMICSNGMVAMSRAFRSSLALGKGNDDISPAIVRVLESFGNDEGYAALRDRVESAQSSWASVHESMDLLSLLLKGHASRGIDDFGGRQMKGTNLAKWLGASERSAAPALGDSAVLGAPVFRAFDAMTGGPTNLYGVANIDALSAKRQRTLPVRCTVYDLVNFATEVATHYSNPSTSRLLQGWVGGLISGEYDMENTRERFVDFKDFHVDATLKSGMTGSDPENN